MSVHFIIDGYNVLLRSGLFDQKCLKDARGAFMAYLGHRRPHGSMRNKLTVVFDGRLEFAGLAGGGEVDVIFTAGASADELIKEMVS
jgi:predicted RNA-binding protein with PIN domain